MTAPAGGHGGGGGNIWSAASSVLTTVAYLVAGVVVFWMIFTWATGTNAVRRFADDDGGGYQPAVHRGGDPRYQQRPPQQRGHGQQGEPRRIYGPVPPPQGQPRVQRYIRSEFPEGQQYCDKYMPGATFVDWVGSGPGRQANCIFR